MIIEEKIIECEKKLLNALENNNISTLEELLHDDLIFNIPTGQTITKQMDIENLKSGVLVIESITPRDQIINIIEDTATVAVTLALKANYSGNKIDNDFRYLRVWKLCNESWKVIAGSGCQI